MNVERFIAYKKAVIDNCSKVIVGKEEQIEQLLTCFICGGHILLEDIPGTGKTMLLRAFAKTIGGEFKRIQFTPDLLPSDLTGINFYHQQKGEFEFRPGPLFSNVVLADEINRATPRTQSALLEAMEEGQITVDGETMKLEAPFMVMATQNPLESYGTFPLPDAQIDRFFMRLSLGYMNRSQEMEVIARPSTDQIVETLTKVISDEDTEYVRSAYTKATVSKDVLAYMMDLIEATRNQNHFVSGVSTRGAIALYNASQVTALLQGRDFVIPEDVQLVAKPILCHRISAGGRISYSDAEKTMSQILKEVKVPLETL